MKSLEIRGTSTDMISPAQVPFPASSSWLAAALAALAFAAAVGVAAGSALYGVAAAIGVLGVLVAVADVRWRRIPNFIVAGMVAYAVAVALVSQVVDLVPVVLGGIAACGPMLGLHLVNPRWVGFGDVKLLFGLGALFGALWWPLGLGVLWAGSVLAIVTRPVVPVSWRRSVPFGFWLSVAAIPFAYFSAKALVS